MKYDYNSDNECFVREDGLGKKFHINSSEAQRIMTLYELGNTISEIRNKMTFASRRVSESSIQNFINNVNEGNIVLSSDLPAPMLEFEDLSLSDKVELLNNKVEKLEGMIMSMQCDCNTKKSWRERLGL